MAYKALYRTYRPSTFDEVAGQQHIVKTLQNALANDKIAHAYLFAGPRGTGKTTMARLFAKALNCEEGIGHQCNNCRNCLSIMEGNHPDVIEIDAASNNGVEEIRDLIDKIKYGTSLGRKKIYIIDEVHVMTSQALNTLLKTLEEPPEHVVFILATTEPHKIIPTILSRCQRFDFTKVSDKDIKERIKVILEKENIEFVEEAIDLIVSLADGGMRDALSMLDQVLAYSGNKLSEKDILDIFSLESKEEKLSLLSAISYGNSEEVITKINNYISKGTDIKRLTNDLLLVFKDLLIFKSSGKTSLLEVTTVNDIDLLDKQLSNDKVKQMINVLLEALKDFKTVSDINTLFEITLLNLTMINVRKTEIKENYVKEEVIAETTQEPIIAQSVNIFEESEAPIIETRDEKIIYLNGSLVENSFSIDETTMINIMVTSKKEIKNSLLDSWEKLHQLSTHPELGRTATLLASGRLLVASPKIMIMEYQLSKEVDKMNAFDMQKSLQDVVSTVFNKKMFVYSISRNDSLNYQKTYMNLLQINKLPKEADIVLNFLGD